MAPMMVAFVAGSVVIGQLIARVPRYRVVGVFGLLLAAMGEWLMASMGPETGYAIVARNLLLVGFGLGGALSAFAIATQNAVPIAQMGVATALGTSGRAIGSTLASAAFGSLLAARLAGATTSSDVLAFALRDTFFATMLMLSLGAVIVLLLEETPLRAYAPAPA
jgi:MFS family permease